MAEEVAVTAITPTEQEPLCDIKAQFKALIDPDHPRRAVWVSSENQLPLTPPGLCRVDLDAGTLYASEHDCGRLMDDPSEEMLADILGYTEAKSGILRQTAAWLPVVRARDAEGHVVWEQVASWGRIGEAMRRAMLYGRPAVLTMDEVLARRKRLIAAEEADA